MARIMIECPETGDPVPTGMTAEEELFENTVYPENTLMGCPACDGVHQWDDDDAFLEG